jgi:hypothetical protein
MLSTHHLLTDDWTHSYSLYSCQYLICQARWRCNLETIPSPVNKLKTVSWDNHCYSTWEVAHIVRHARQPAVSSHLRSVDIDAGKNNVVKSFLYICTRGNLNCWPHNPSRLMVKNIVWCVWLTISEYDISVGIHPLYTTLPRESVCQLCTATDIRNIAVWTAGLTTRHAWWWKISCGACGLP